MAKGQQYNNKMVKKPKKDTSPPKAVSPDAVRPNHHDGDTGPGKLQERPPAAEHGRIGRS